MVDLTSPAGASLSWSEVYPYGDVRLAGDGAGAPAVQPFGFTGEQLDGVTGLYHLRARQYDPGTGRFLTTDPVTMPISSPYVASYAYAWGNPAYYTDPSGRNPAVCGVVLGALAPANAIPGAGTLVDLGAFATCLAVAGMITTGVAVAQNPPSIAINIANPQRGASPQPGPAPIPTYEPFPNAYDQTHPDLNPDLLGRQSPWRPCSSTPCRLGVAGLIFVTVWNMFTSQGRVPPFSRVPAGQK